MRLPTSLACATGWARPPASFLGCANHGRLAIGLHADAEAVGDLDVLASGIEDALERLDPEQPAWHASRLSVVQ
jgi:hypothetical protein